MNERPLFSIITVTYNCKDDLSLTVESLKKQTFQNFELINIDGRSTDGTLEYVKENSSIFSYHKSEKDKGIYDAMNKGIKQAKGKYLQFLNAGDILHDESSLEKVAKASDSSDPDIIASGYIIADKNYKTVYTLNPKEFTVENLKTYGTGTVNHQSFFIKKEITPLYSLKYQLKGELDWYFQILKETPSPSVEYVNTPIIIYKLGGAGAKRYIRNLIEWILVTQKRFGFKQNKQNIQAYKNFINYIKKTRKHWE